MEYKTIVIGQNCREYSKSIVIQLFAPSLSASAFNFVSNFELPEKHFFTCYCVYTMSVSF